MVDGNHFFKCMIHGHYAEKLIIPKAFRIKRLNGVGDRKHAKLQNKMGETWNVNMRSNDEEMWLDKGWKEFVKDNEVNLGDFLVFKHKGNMVFDVLLFDPSACEKEYCSTSKKKNTAAKHKIAAPKQDPLKAAEAYRTSRPHFIKQIKTNSSLKTPLDIPLNFARSNGLLDNGKKITLSDHRKKNSQNVNLLVRQIPHERVRFGSGTTQFLNRNDI